MSDDLALELGKLAPSVDTTASRELFERHRSATAGGDTGTPRWWLAAAAIALVVAGLVGLWAMNGNDETVPLDEVPSTEPFVGPATEGDGYETILVAETAAGFGDAVLATADADYGVAWERLGTSEPAPTVDLDRTVVLVMTRPDNACADTIVRFDVTPGAGDVTWTPVFEDLSEACEDPLLSWVYVVALDRRALGSAATVRIPAADPYGVPEAVLSYASDGSILPTDAEPDGVRVTATGITVPLPPVGEPALYNTSVGFVWVVAHDGDTVSVLPGTLPRTADEDAGGVTGLHVLVRASDSGRTFSALGRLWDDHGRAIAGGRANDLVGFAGRLVDPDVDRVDGAEVEILDSGATRIEGDPNPVLAVSGEAYPLPDLPPLIDLPTFMTLSSSGPIWRHLDATLVVENGIGRICDVPDDVPVPDLETCGGAEFVLDTQITSSQPDITSWYAAPILGFQDPLRGFTAVVPLGGQASRNDAPADEPIVEVTGSRFECTDPPGLLLRVDLLFSESSSVELVVLDGDTELGSATTQGRGEITVGFTLDDTPTQTARLIVSHRSFDVELELPTADDLDCGT